MTILQRMAHAEQNSGSSTPEMIKQHYGHHDDEWQDDGWSWNDGYDEWSSWYGYEDDYDYKWTEDDEQQSGDWS
eukprot:8282476-Pyramimonas_sp.AAC.1